MSCHNKHVTLIQCLADVDHRRRRWANINSALDQCNVFASPVPRAQITTIKHVSGGGPEKVGVLRGGKRGGGKSGRGLTLEALITTKIVLN